MDVVKIKECAQYKKTKSCRRKRKSPHADMKRWEPLLSLPSSGSSLRRGVLAPLSKASTHWGIERVQYYQWAYMGLSYCSLIGTAAARNTSWKEATIKLNQLLLNRIHNQQPLKLSKNPIRSTDLRCLGVWLDQNQFEETSHSGSKLPYNPVLRSDLPPDYTFDRYGLIVWKEFGCPNEVVATSCTQTTAEY
jgi:hypothetical protein